MNHRVIIGPGNEPTLRTAAPLRASGLPQEISPEPAESVGQARDAQTDLIPATPPGPAAQDLEPLRSDLRAALHLVLQTEHPLPGRRNLRVALTPLPEPDLEQAEADYHQHRNLLATACCRKPPGPSEHDHQAALEAVRWEHLALGREPGRVADFRRLCAFLQSPAAAMLVLHDLSRVPEKRRERVLESVLEGVRSMRDRTAWPQDPPQAAGEYGGVEGISGRLSLAGRVCRPGQSLNEALEELKDARDHLWGPLKKELHDEAMEAATLRRAPEEGLDLAAGKLTVDFVRLTQRGLDARGALALLQACPRADIEELDACAVQLRSMRVPGQDAARLLAQAFRNQELPGARALEPLLHSYELTGDGHGLEQARQQLAAGLESGQLQGTLDDLTARLEHRLLELRLIQPDGRKRLSMAMEELMAVEPGTSRLALQGDYLLVGGTRLRTRNPRPA